MENIDVKIVSDDKDLIPFYANDGDAGMDLKSSEDFEIAPLSTRLVPTGIKIKIPSGYVGLIHPRSGLAAKSDITVLNAPGTIDSGYIGEIKVVLYNASPKNTFCGKKGDRIAQIVFQKFSKANFIEVCSLEETARGEGGFGSSGIQ